MASEHGPHHRWDTSRSRCLDCGRDAEEIADELEQQLAQAREESRRLTLLLDPNKAGVSAVLEANREIESLHYQLRNVQRLVHKTAVRGEYVEQQLAQARALLQDALDDWAHPEWHDAEVEDKIRAFLAQREQQ